MYLLFFAVSFLASTIGAICGIGGGVIIKPALDALGALPVESVNFLSGATVLSMAAYSVARAGAGKAGGIDLTASTPLAAGAMAGGIVGRRLFSLVAGVFGSADAAGAVQAAVLMAVTAGTLAYTLNKERIRPVLVDGAPARLAIGLGLGAVSSFLGIGGGPINLVVLYHFFGMGTKEAARNSLYVILFSQAASTAQTLLTGGLALPGPALVAGMAAAGVLGGAVGRAVNARIDAARVDALFEGLMVAIILINIYNVAKYAIPA